MTKRVWFTDKGGIRRLSGPRTRDSASTPSIKVEKERKYRPVELIVDENDPRHGTRAGVDAHKKAKVEKCQLCREWNRTRVPGRRVTKEDLES